MLTYLANPHRFLRFSRYAIPVFGAFAILLGIFGLWQALFVSPPDYQQGEAVRIFYVHVPAASCALAGYTALAIASFISFVWRHPVADIAARSIAVPGAAFTFLALVTGALWGKPMWGTYWQWDGRMTSVLILFFIYMAYLSLWSLIDDEKRASRLAGILAMVGVINIPIIKFSVEWWNSLHQPATISTPGAPGLPPELLTPFLAMLGAYICFYSWLVLMEMKTRVLDMQQQRTSRRPVANVKMETL